MFNPWEAKVLACPDGGKARAGLINTGDLFLFISGHNGIEVDYLGPREG
jgi:hypothetical protein